MTKEDWREQFSCFLLVLWMLGTGILIAAVGYLLEPFFWWLCRWMAALADKLPQP